MESANFTFQVQYDSELFEVYVRLRPHFHEFLEWVSKRFEVRVSLFVDVSQPQRIEEKKLKGPLIIILLHKRPHSVTLRVVTLVGLLFFPLGLHTFVLMYVVMSYPPSLFSSPLLSPPSLPPSLPPLFSLPLSLTLPLSISPSP